MAIETADIVVRTAERLKIVAEGCEVSSADRVSIERAVEDAYNAVRTELRLAWALDDIPADSVMGLTIIAASLAASPTNAPDAAMHEGKYDFGVNELRRVNRIRPDNSIPVEYEDC